jgi:hypothetical protein
MFCHRLSTENVLIPPLVWSAPGGEASLRARSLNDLVVRHGCLAARATLIDPTRELTFGAVSS